MVKVISVRFADAGKAYFFDPGSLSLKRGQGVIVETANGLEFGKIVDSAKEIDKKEVVKPLKPVIRIATEDDLRQVAENKELEKEAKKICEEKIAEHKLKMHLSTAEYSFDRTKIIFYFTADGRVDFRELVKDLGATFHKRIELRQVGVRDESKLLGGLGMCGRPFCCSTFLNGFHSVTIKMAKDQGLSLSPGKISGTCGRLMCCLKYEQRAYEYLHKITPKVGTVVDCKHGRGTVVEASILTGQLKVQLDNSPEGLPVVINREEAIPVRKDKLKKV